MNPDDQSPPKNAEKTRRIAHEEPHQSVTTEMNPEDQSPPENAESSSVTGGTSTESAGNGDPFIQHPDQAPTDLDTKNWR